MITSPYLRLAVAQAKKNGKIFKKNFGHPGNVKIKNGDPRNFVTEIDLLIETNIREAIAKKFPKHKIIGEEFSRARENNTDYFWILDPIDGTTNFINGVPFCCISIGLWDKKGPLMGVVYNPVLEMLYVAERGKGAYLNGKKITCPKISKLSEAIGAIGWLYPEGGIKIFSKLVRVCRKVRVYATSTWQACLVASGNLGFFTTNEVNIWDIAAAACIVREAGGKITEINGKPLSLHSQSVLVTGGKIHNELIKYTKQL